MLDWLRKLFHRKKKALCNDNDFSLKWRRFEQQVGESERRDEKIQAIAEKNQQRQKDTLGFGLKSRNFRPRPASEKKLWNMKEKPPKKLEED